MNITRRQVLIGAGVLVAIGSTSAFRLLSEPEYDKPIYASDGVAIDGTDTVAYFTQGGPVEGSPEHAVDWKGATWRFASADNLELFSANPEKYAPAYGGYCAWAVAEKKQLFSTQPRNWAIVDDRLFLNYNDSIQEKWDGNRAGFITMGDENWLEILKDFATG